jgi:hypothetical protein
VNIGCSLKPDPAGQSNEQRVVDQYAAMSEAAVAAAVVVAAILHVGTGMSTGAAQAVPVAGGA